MGKINLEDISAGMVLDAEVTDPSGRVLLAAGSEVMEKHLRIFKMWGVTEADVRGVDKEEADLRSAAQVDAMLLRRAQAKGRNLFRHTDMRHPFVKELLRLVTLRIAGRGAEGAGRVP